MAEVKSNGQKYNDSYALVNSLNYYGYGCKPGSDWDYWTAYGVDNKDYELAQKQMLKTKKKYNQYRGVQMHQIYIKISYKEMSLLGERTIQIAEKKLVDSLGQYFYSYGLQNISFVYQNRIGIFVRMIVNSTSESSGKNISNIKPFVDELNTLLNGLF